MFCQNCGAQMNAGDRTCKRCGAPVRQAANQYQNYAQPAEGYHREEHVSTGGWIGINFLMLIPIVNIILLIVWAFGGSRQRSLQTWARAKKKEETFANANVSVFFSVVYFSSLSSSSKLENLVI